MDKEVESVQQDLTKMYETDDKKVIKELFGEA